MMSEQERDYGSVVMRIDEILQERGISKNKVCKDLDIPRPNFNRYCRGEFQRIDTGLLSKLCWYLNITPGELIVYRRPEE